MAHLKSHLKALKFSFERRALYSRHPEPQEVRRALPELARALRMGGWGVDGVGVLGCFGGRKATLRWGAHGNGRQTPETPQTNPKTPVFGQHWKP